MLDIHEQISWIRAAGFDGVGLHASAGQSGSWRGIAPESAELASRLRIQKTLAEFDFVEIHAPFAVHLRSDCLLPNVADLEPTLDLAADLGAQVVTVHASPPLTPSPGTIQDWSKTLRMLSAEAALRDVIVGLEITTGFDWISELCSAHLGVTLDVGHLYLDDARPLRAAGGLDTIVHTLGRDLRHIHLHQVVGSQDHWAPGSVPEGAGVVDYGELSCVLNAIGYSGGINLEINPDLSSPDEIRASRRWLQTRLAEALRVA